MARRKNKISFNLQGQETIHTVGSFEEGFHLFWRDAKSPCTKQTCLSNSQTVSNLGNLSFKLFQKIYHPCYNSYKHYNK